MNPSPLFLSWIPARGPRPVGAVLVFDRKEAAEQHAESLRYAQKTGQRYRGRTVRVFERRIKAGGLIGICWVVVVKTSAETAVETAKEISRAT